ncbi:hypothetical protein J0383_13425 [Flavobacterium endoglycinae]|uniref:Uncharacterized protein n=1 Tax=Flavobacterium endoglycinae TaxID=2816357 RepID=A0ABX7Q8N8_9FLAO|nr:hypothetical protein [Flavobacterium endoglycinae]QSW87297.1 hypothetical protein J0383_13425 [Flavobacterium endoglycinae]
MGLLEETIQNKKELYDLATQYLEKIDPQEIENLNFDNVVSKSISILINHDFIKTPCIEINLELQKDQVKAGNYFLYIDENKQFLDEFLF